MNKAIFLDRDGVINENRPFIHNMENVIFIKGALKALKLISDFEYKSIIITNQPVVGRGICTEKEYSKFSEDYINLLKENGVTIDAVYSCYHHPTHGKGKYLKDCICRKPKPGMLLKAKKKLDINMKESFMIGDKRSDILAGKRAGCKTILVKTGCGGKGGTEDLDVQSDYISDDLLSAVNMILKKSSKT